MSFESKATAAGVFYAISSHVEELGRERVHPAFLLDESYLPRQEVLDHLHVLSNYHWDAKSLLLLVLVGLPDLWDRLKIARNRSLWSRTHCHICIEDASDGDTVEYIYHRLEQAGAAPTIFTSDAFTVIHEATSGRLRDVDRLATLALKSAARQKLEAVDRDVVVRGLLEDD
jgi:general secretion pathway protein A